MFRGRQALSLSGSVVRVSDSDFFSFSSEVFHLSIITVLGWTACFRSSPLQVECRV